MTLFLILDEQVELGLSKEEVAKRVQAQLNIEYNERIFAAIENSREIAELSPNLGDLLVAQARSILTMKSIAEQLNENLDNHLKTTREKLIHEHPIKSKIARWIDRKLFEERINYMHQHEWDAHQLAIDQCKALGNLQAAYFIERDYLFRKDHELNLRQKLKPQIEPLEKIQCTRMIWLPRNYIVERTYPLPVERIPTLFSKRKYTAEKEEARQRLIDSDREAKYECRKTISYETTTRYPFWRWKLFAVRTFCWLSNTIFCLCIVVPYASPVSFRALLSPKPFSVGYNLNEGDLKLHEETASTTQTFISRLAALWSNVRHSRREFERTPDRGFLGKNVQRMFNRLWNYVIKGALGTVATCIIYPIVCSVVPTLSFISGVLSPIWLPIVTFLFHILEILVYDANSAGEYGRKLFCLINIIMTDFLIGGIIQPILALVGLIASPVASLLITIYALLHRSFRGLYDQIIYHLIVKRLARIPAHDTFLARRIAGPGLAAQYFYQVASPEVLAALESMIEQKELKCYGSYVEKILRKPIHEYQEFFNQAFNPFSAQVSKIDKTSTYARMNDVVDEHIKELRNTIEKRHNLLRLERSTYHDRIRLTETDLTAVLVKGTELVGKWYPSRILPYLNETELEKFWHDLDLEPNDWFGLTSKLLQELFCRDFLTPLEQTDAFYSLEVDQLTLSKYAQMIHSANIHDDLDVVTSVYLPETSYSLTSPSFNQNILDPNQSILEISTDYSANQIVSSHGRIYRFFYREETYTKPTKNSSSFVDYTSATCRFSIPIPLSEVAFVNIIIFNRDHNDSTTTVSIKNITLEDISRLIQFNKKFYTEPLLPIHSAHVASSTRNNNTTNHNVFLVDITSDKNDHESLNHNISVLDEKLF
ncbi:unnamed protein product [Rotaria magnacalcarata]|uniref:Uncharacterized protein n=2 Tax=Rotaria magnacalcarata TaxID=392030 RepID=A0A814RUY5_9BILA|nr:unnamed protein product [Rotaria magnacalcarata]